MVQHKKSTILVFASVLALLALSIPAQSNAPARGAGPIESLTLTWEDCTTSRNFPEFSVSIVGTFDNVDYETFGFPDHWGPADQIAIFFEDANGLDFGVRYIFVPTGSTIYEESNLFPYYPDLGARYWNFKIRGPLKVRIIDVWPHDIPPDVPREIFVVGEFTVDFPCDASSEDQPDVGDGSSDTAPVPSFFDPGDGRMDPRPGDRLAVYCEQPEQIRVWGVDDESIGFPLADFDASQVMQAGPGGVITDLGANGTLSISGDENGYFYIAWNGGMHSATGQGDFSKAFQCVF